MSKKPKRTVTGSLGDFAAIMGMMGGRKNTKAQHAARVKNAVKARAKRWPK